MNGKVFLKSVFSRPIAFHPALARITGSITAGLMLSQAIYWTDTLDNEREGWFHKTQEEWQKETCLTRYEQENARKVLKSMKLLTETRRGLNPVIWFRVDFDVLQTLLNQSGAGNQHQAMTETSSRQGGKPAAGEGGNQQQVRGKTSSAYKEAEITTENTSETTNTERALDFPAPVQNPTATARPNSQPGPERRKQGLSAEERASWDLRRWREAMDANAPQVGTQAYYAKGAEHDALYVRRAKDAAYQAGITIPRVVELLRPYFESERERRLLEELLESGRQLELAEAR